MHTFTLSVLFAMGTITGCATPVGTKDNADAAALPEDIDSPDEDADQAEDEQPEDETDADADADADLDADADADADAEIEESWMPTQGTWTVQSSILTIDECGLEDVVNRGEPGTTLALSGADGAFNMLFEAGENVACEINDDLEFFCSPTSTIDSTATDMGMDADIPVVIQTEGYFTDEKAMWMESVVDIDCAGPACGLIQILLGTSFPCTMAMASDLVID